MASVILDSTLFVLANDSLTGLGLDTEARVARSLAVESSDWPDDRDSSPSLATGAGLLLHQRGDFEDALTVFTWTLERFGQSVASEDLRLAISARTDSLLKLGRSDECTQACAEGLEAIGDPGDGDVLALRDDTF